MERNGEARRSGRESMLSLTLALLFGGGFLLFLILVSGGFFFYVLSIAAVIAALGGLHYALWGFLMSQEVEAERRAEEEKQRHEDDGDPGRDQLGIRRF